MTSGTTPLWLFASPIGKLLLFGLSNLIVGGGFIMMVKGTMPPPMTRIRANPILATLVFLIGLTFLMQFGVPDLFTQLRTCSPNCLRPA